MRTVTASLVVVAALATSLVASEVSGQTTTQQQTTVVYQEQNGEVVVEVESQPVAGGWSPSTTISGYTGSSYYVWDGGQQSQGGNGVLTYRVNITSPGNYQFNWRSRITEGSSRSDANDSFVSLSGTPISGQHPIGTNEWTKAYQNQLNTWSWNTATKDFDAQPIRQFFSAGEHVIRISGRSPGHGIDRFVLFKYEDKPYESSFRPANSTQANTLTNLPPSPTAAEPVPPSSSVYGLLVSSSADRSGAESLSGATVDGDVFVFTAPDSGVVRVRFYVDDPAAVGPPVRTETIAPYDLAGSSVSTARAFDTTTLSDGAHSITAEIDTVDGGTETVTATFTVANDTSTTTSSTTTTTTSTTSTTTTSMPTTTSSSTTTSTTLPSSSVYGLLVSSSADRSGAESLSGATVDGDVFVFTAPDSGVVRVRFYVDDPAAVGPPVRTETIAPYDLAGGSVSTARAFDTTTLSDGAHSITAEIDTVDGGTETVTATFTVANTDATLGVLSADPSSVSFDVVEGGSGAVGVTVSGDGAAPVLSVSESASWLTVGASSASEFTASVNSTGLVPGVYNTVITFSAAGYGPLVVPVSLTVTAPPPDPGGVLYRVNAGGPSVGSNDGGPSWSADVPASSPSPYVNHGTGNDRAFTVPAGTVSAAGVAPAALFETERWDPAGGNAMEWNFPVASGKTYEVSLFMSEKFFGVSPTAVGGVGARVFDVAIEGAVVLDDLDLFAELGPAVGGVFTFDVPVVDGAVTVGFTRSVNNPTIDAIEVRRAEPAANTLSVSRQSVDFGAVVVGESRVESVTLSNVGVAGDPVISGISAVAAGAGMSVSKVPAASLQPGQSTTVEVTFAPGAVGVVDGSLVVSHSGVNSPVTVDLDGSGVSAVPVGFQVDGISLAGLTNPTSLDFGPDGRLYVSQQNGLIKAYTLQRNGVSDYSIVSVESINLVQGIKNHNDDGSASTVANRQVTGLMTAGTASSPVLYVSSSDPRIAGGKTGGDAGLDTNSGVISKLTKSGSSWSKVDLVRGLPRSEENHSTNGMTIDEATNTMYVMSGGFTNKGAPSNNFAGTPEYALAAALLSVDLDVIEALSTKTDQYGQLYKYDLPTLNDPTRNDKSGAAAAAPSADVNDPWGGNDGLNQSIIVPGGPVQVYSAGYRNAYDVVLTEAGKLYTWDNGPNTGWGGTPVGEGTANCTNQLNEADSAGKPDGLHHITGEGYYAGHPNPTRGNANSGYIQYVNQGGVWVAQATYAWSDFPVRPVPLADIDPRECDYLSPADPKEDASLATISSSTNGMAEYTASNFGGAMKGNLLAAAFNGSVYRTVLSANGTQVVSNTALLQGFGSTPLDVIAVGDDGVFPGTVWAVTYGSDSLVVFEPNDYAGGGGVICTGLANANDDDGDGFTNANEIAAGTDPCNAGSVPSDFDGDFIPDVVDTDDDGDGILDVADVFALDAANGLATPVAASCPADFSNDTVPSCLRMSAGSRSPSILDLGFTGLMLNGEDYLDQFDQVNVVNGGAAGVLGVKATTNGDVTAASNSQDNGFQFGVLQPNVPFEVHTRIKSPFTSGPPQNGQAVGIQVGNGTQSNFVSLMLTANGGTGGIRLGHEINDTFSVVAQPNVAGVVGTVDTDLFLTINPTTKLITAEYSLDGGVTRVPLGTTTTPASWVQAGTALAVGVMSTSGGAPAFNANWDFIDVTTVEPPLALTGERALIQIKPGDTNINASTFGNGSFIVTNQSDNGIEIDSIVFDLQSAVLPDMVFDPAGTAGDLTAKAFTPNSGATATGYTGFDYLEPHQGDPVDGYDGLGVDFGDFDPNETFTFSIDVDPTSIQGLPAPGPNSSGSVSGLELTGTSVTVTFSNGAARTGYLFADGSNGGARAVVADALPGAPQLAMPGVAGTTTSTGAQTLQVSGPAGATVKILHVDAGLFVAPGVTFADPLYLNSIVSQLVATVTLNASGTASTPVTLRNLNATAGINHFTAVIESTGVTGTTSQPVTVKYQQVGVTPG